MKLLLVDDDPLVLKALTMILKSSGFEIKTAQNHAQALKAFEEEKFDVFILDVRIKEENGVDLAKKILDKSLKEKIMLLTTFNDEKDISRAFSYGVLGVILKDNVDSLIGSIQSVYHGNRVIDHSLKSSLIFKEKIYEDDLLSPKENEVLRAISMGLNNKEIAEELFLSEGTVRNYISSMLTKLNLRDRTQLAIYYYQSLK